MSWSSVFFVKNIGSDEYVKCFDLKSFGDQCSNDMDTVLFRIYDCFIQNHQKPWEQLCLSVKNTGDFKVNFKYDVNVIDALTDIGGTTEAQVLIELESDMSQDGIDSCYSKLALNNDYEAFWDEAQFLSAEEVDTLSDIVDFYEIPVLCYGLRTDSLNHLFPGSRRLMESADVIEEVPTVCWCGKRAQCNTRYADGKIVREGAQIMLGSNESYVALCRKHYKEGKLWNPTDND